MRKIKTIFIGLLAFTFLGNAQVVTLANATLGCSYDMSTGAQFFQSGNANLPKVQVVTFVGSDEGFANGMGTSAKFSQPGGMVLDAKGNLYVADTFNHLIRKITPKGQVSTFAGSTQGYADGKGTAAKFNAPMGLTIDEAGNLYVAVSNCNKIRKITPDAVVSTLAGFYQGDSDGKGKAAHFCLPSDVAIDKNGNVYVTDTFNHKIKKITPQGQVSTFAGSSQGYADGKGSTALFNSPQGIVIDGAGNIYVADGFNNKIRKITPEGEVSTFAGSSKGDIEGKGSSAQFNTPSGLAIDKKGNLYVCDQENHKIKKITSEGVVTTLAGSTPGYADGPAAEAKFYYPWGIEVDSAGNVYVAGTFNNKIRKIIVK